jgi:hypothetical protein
LWQVEDPSGLLGHRSRECTPAYLSTGISNLLQPAQAEVVLGHLSTYLASWHMMEMTVEEEMALPKSDTSQTHTPTYTNYRAPVVLFESWDVSVFSLLIGMFINFTV